jgi:alkylation response protein AidB-like acyl-CoA dehydrogenase
MEGVSRREIKGKLGLCGQPTAELFFDDLRVPDTARLGEQGRGFALAMSTLDKLFASEAAVRAANNGLQVFGGAGYIDETPVGKYLRDARVTTLYEGTSQTQQQLSGRALTGVNAFV